jgi:integrase
MSRNANGEGSIYRWNKNGKPCGYKGALSYRDENGDTKRYVAYGRTRKDVKDKLDKARERMNAGAPIKDAKRTVGDWLAHWRVTTLAASDRKESTRVQYASLSRNHLESEPFGAIPLDRIKPSDIDALVLAMKARALSDSTVRLVYTVLRAGLDGAVRDGLIARNPAALVARPSVERREAKHLDASGVAAVLNAAQSSRHYSAMALIAATGLRRGEALGLAWDRVDLDAGVLRVTATLSRVGRVLVITEPKTTRSRRTVPIPLLS